MILGTEPGIKVIGEAADGQEAIDRCAELAPDVVLMDVRMPHVDGIEATRAVTAGAAPPRVLMLTTFDLDEDVYDALRAGRAGSCSRTHRTTADAAMRVVAEGGALLAPSVTRRLIAEFARPPGGRPPTPALTEREREVLQLVARGLSNAEIAAERRRRDTVKTHVARVLMKLDLRDRIQAVVLAYESGWCGLPAERSPARHRPDSDDE